MTTTATETEQQPVVYDMTALMRRFRLPQQQQQRLRRVLNDLERQGMRVLRVQRVRCLLPAQMPVLEAELRRRGFDVPEDAHVA